LNRQSTNFKIQSKTALLLMMSSLMCNGANAYWLKDSPPGYSRFLGTNN